MQEKHQFSSEVSLLFIRRKVTQAISYHPFLRRTRFLFLTVFSLWKLWASPIFVAPKIWIISLLVPPCFALNITSYISYFSLEKWEIFPSFYWPNSFTKMPGVQFFLGGEYSEWNRRLVPEPIQNKQRIFLQMSIPILIYVSNFVYFTIQEKKKKRLRNTWGIKRNLSIPKETEV